MSMSGELGLSTEMTLKVRMASATGTTQPICHLWYYDKPSVVKDDGGEYSLQYKQTALDDMNDVIICEAPITKETVRVVTKFILKNRSTATEIMELRMDAGSTLALLEQTLLTLQSLHYSQSAGFQVVGA